MIDFGLHIQTSEGWVSDPVKAMHACRQAMNDYTQIRTQLYEDQDGALRPMLKPEHTFEFHRQQRAWLETKLAEPFDGPTVVITHHAPRRNSVPEEYERDWIFAAYASESPAHFFDFPVLWVHRHTHVSLDYHAKVDAEALRVAYLALSGEIEPDWSMAHSKYRKTWMGE